MSCSANFVRTERKALHRRMRVRHIFLPCYRDAFSKSTLAMQVSALPAPCRSSARNSNCSVGDPVDLLDAACVRCSSSGCPGLSFPDYSPEVCPILPRGKTSAPLTCGQSCRPGSVWGGWRVVDEVHRSSKLYPPSERWDAARAYVLTSVLDFELRNHMRRHWRDNQWSDLAALFRFQGVQRNAVWSWRRRCPGRCGKRTSLAPGFRNLVEEVLPVVDGSEV